MIVKRGLKRKIRRFQDEKKLPFFSRRVSKWSRRRHEKVMRPWNDLFKLTLESLPPLWEEA